MMKRSVLAAVLLFSSPAWAADGLPSPERNSGSAQAGGVDGVVRDKSGHALPDAQVKLQDGQGNIVKTTTSNTNGIYSFSAVPSGSYVVLIMQKDAMRPPFR
jgi:hypothetical protein